MRQRDFHFDDVSMLNFINLNSSDMEMLRKWRNHKDIRKWMYSSHLISKEEHKGFIKKLKKDTSNFYWMVTKAKEYLGAVYMNGVNFKHKTAYIGIYKNPFCKLKEAGTVIMQSGKKVAFDIWGLHTLKLEVREDNEVAYQFYKKNGFRNEGRLREIYYTGKDYLDLIVMGVLNR